MKALHRLLMVLSRATVGRAPKPPSAPMWRFLGKQCIALRSSMQVVFLCVICYFVSFHARRQLPQCGCGPCAPGARDLLSSCIDQCQQCPMDTPCSSLRMPNSFSGVVAPSADAGVACVDRFHFTSVSGNGRHGCRSHQPEPGNTL